MAKAKDPKFPRPQMRVTKIVNLAVLKHPSFSLRTDSLRESGLAPALQTWRIDLDCSVYQAAADLSKLVDDDMAPEIRALLKKRSKKKLEVRDVVFQVLKDIENADWGWKLFGVRCINRESLSSARAIGKVIHMRDLKVEDLPNKGCVMMFGGEPAAQQAWDLTLLAKNSLVPEWS